MSLVLSISPHGRPFVEEVAETDAASAHGSAAVNQRIRDAFGVSPAVGLLHLATVELSTPLAASLGFAREVAQRYMTALCHVPGLDAEAKLDRVPPPAAEELAELAEQAPPLRGLEYLTPEVLSQWWIELDEHVRSEIARFAGGATAWLRERSPLWRQVGRVTFHLAENKRDPQYPFAFLATYARRMSSQSVVQHVPLNRALQEFAGARNRQALLTLLTPIHRAAEKCAWVAELVESGEIYQPMAWTPKEAHQFLKDLPLLEESGLVVRIPNWWKPSRPPRPQVSVKIGEAAKSALGVDSMLDFSVGATLGGESLSDAEVQQLLESTGGLVRLRGQWVEVDRDKLSEALKHWRSVERDARSGGISFFEGMRLLAGADFSEAKAQQNVEEIRQWSSIAPGEWLDQTLAELRDPAASAPPRELKADLRPYQQTGVGWLRFMVRLGLGACLADDMGLGKTIQVIAMLLHAKSDRAKSKSPANPNLLVVPASLIGNWKSELARFAPSLSAVVVHPSELGQDVKDAADLQKIADGRDLVITTYGMLARIAPLRQQKWNCVILDEAQAIKNSGTRQSRAVKELTASARIALTGTPVENRLSDLWSLFDFLNPGLLGGVKAFSELVKEMDRDAQHAYGPLRTLVRPYILRRLKTDKRIISDLPDKTEVRAFCALTKPQAALYEQSVRELARQIEAVEGIQRRGIVLAFLLRLKQICNHPAQWTGTGDYDPQLSGKFARLTEICEELAARQEKVLVFTQFREMTAPLAAHLAKIFSREGLILHGGSTIPKRREMVEAFQRDDGPPFFVLSLKAGGTGLNLTAASHVIHFDRWWNPAVENQATDRAFRIGQKRNVMVHKFVCQGTVEERIDAMIAGKVGMSRDLLEEEAGAEKLLTEMDNRELLRFVSLDIGKAMET
jgi:non-specific serine/threonine protein kinase